MQEQNETDSDVSIGKIAGVYGLKGWVKILSFTRPKENIIDYTTWYLGCGEQQIEKSVLECKVQGKGLIARLEDVSDRDQAIGLKNKEIFVRRTQLPDLEDGEYYWQDLIGLQVIDQDQKILGKVSKILETGANDVFVVSGKKRILIPWVSGIYVEEINPEAGHILVKWQGDED